CAAPLAEVPRVHRHGCSHAGAGHWRDYLYFYFGASRFIEVAGSGESRRIVPSRERITLLLLGRVQSRERVFPCLVRFVQILQRPRQRFFGISGVLGGCAAVWCPARGCLGGGPQLLRRVRV